MKEGFSLVALDGHRRASDGKVPDAKLRQIEALAKQCPGVRKATAKGVTRVFTSQPSVSSFNVLIDIEVDTDAASTDLHAAFKCIDEKLHTMGTHSDGYG